PGPACSRPGVGVSADDGASEGDPAGDHVAMAGLRTEVAAQADLAERHRGRGKPPEHVGLDGDQPAGVPDVHYGALPRYQLAGQLPVVPGAGDLELDGQPAGAE